MRWASRTHVKIGLTVATPWSLGCAFETLMAEGFLNRIGDAYLWRDAPAPRFRIAERAQMFH